VAESPEFGGRIIDALYNDPRRIEVTGQVFYSAELAERYGVTDVDGGHPPSGRGFIGPPTEFSAVVIE
jgi:hypothetical protein